MHAMNVLVTGGTGLVGSHVVRELASRGVEVSVLTRDPAKAKQLPQGVKAVEGNLLEPASVRRAFAGVDGVFLLNPVTQTEASEALMAVMGMREARLKRLVYLSVQNADRAAWLPHFGSKVGVEAGIRRSGISFTILRPNNFFQNDYWLKDALLKYGVYPQPIGDVGVSRVDVRDIAEAAAVALTTGGHEGESYDVVGPEAHTGESTARAWSEALGKRIQYGGNDLDAWEKQSLQYLPDWMVFDLRMMFQYFQQEGLKAAPEALERQAKLIGHAPRSFAAFTAETAAAWQGPQAT
jgi:uncharacterized protein YbjT (DUF2867 family)